jgi:hypothetical protein
MAIFRVPLETVNDPGIIAWVIVCTRWQHLVRRIFQLLDT